MINHCFFFFFHGFPLNFWTTPALFSPKSKAGHGPWSRPKGGPDPFEAHAEHARGARCAGQKCCWAKIEVENQLFSWIELSIFIYFWGFLGGTHFWAIHVWDARLGIEQGPGLSRKAQWAKCCLQTCGFLWSRFLLSSQRGWKLGYQLNKPTLLLVSNFCISHHPIFLGKCLIED